MYAQVARIYVSRGDLQKSEQLLRKALALGSNNATVMVLLSDVLEREGQLEER